MDNYIVNIIDDHSILVTDQLYYNTQYYNVSQTRNEQLLIQELLKEYKLNFNQYNTFKVFRTVGAWSGIVM